MASRKSNPGKTELKRTITPIGQDVPKGGLAIDPKKEKNTEGNEENRAYTVKIQKLQKDDGFQPKIGPKQIIHKLGDDILPDIKLDAVGKKIKKS